MSKLFGGIFGRAEKSVPTSVSTVYIDGEELDVEYEKYCIEQERTVSALESSLHESDDPKEIAEGALIAACLFYGGDWAGILDVDLDLDVWTPLWWYTQNPEITQQLCLVSLNLQSICQTGLKLSRPVLRCASPT